MERAATSGSYKTTAVPSHGNTGAHQIVSASLSEYDGHVRRPELSSRHAGQYGSLP